jgi:hypothetical protein
MNKPLHMIQFPVMLLGGKDAWRNFLIHHIEALHLLTMVQSRELIQ